MHTGGELYSGPIYYWLSRGISHAVALLSQEPTQHCPRNSVQQGLDPQEYHVADGVGDEELCVDVQHSLRVAETQEGTASPRDDWVAQIQL